MSCGTDGCDSSQWETKSIINQNIENSEQSWRQGSRDTMIRSDMQRAWFNCLLTYRGQSKHVLMLANTNLPTWANENYNVTQHCVKSCKLVSSNHGNGGKSCRCVYLWDCWAVGVKSTNQNMVQGQVIQTCNQGGNITSSKIEPLSKEPYWRQTN